MIISRGYINHEVQLCHDFVAAEDVATRKTIEGTAQYRITMVARRSPVFQVLPVNMKSTASVIRYKVLSHSQLKSASNIISFIINRSKELLLIGRAWAQKSEAAA